MSQHATFHFSEHIYIFHLTLFGSCFTLTELWSKGCAMTLNQVSRSKVKVMAELYKKKNLDWIIYSFLLIQSGLYFTNRVPWSKIVQWPWTKFFGQGHIRLVLTKISVSYILHILHINWTLVKGFAVIFNHIFRSSIKVIAIFIKIQFLVLLR